MQSKTVLIVGGAGYIGSHTNKFLTQKGFHTVVFDNLSRGRREAVVEGKFIQGDIGNPQDLNNLFQSYHFDAVLHFAALTDVGESTKHPLLYYQANVVNSLKLIEVMVKHNVRAFVFSSSAAIFGEPKTPVIAEDHPCHPINVYGRTKLIVETFLADCDKAYNLKSCCLRYFNACGGDREAKIPTFYEKQHNLIPLIFQSLEAGRPLTIFGQDYPTKDGTCIRDYIDVADLAQAHYLGMEKLWRENVSCAYNLGNGRGYSVKEVIATVEKVTGRKVNVEIGPRRPGDPPYLLANAEKAMRELGWKPKYSDLEDMVAYVINARLKNQ